jgi:diguanylate cyclase (GGDEF)-like protein
MSDSAIDRLRGLLDVAAAVRTGGELRSVLEAVAAAIAGPLGYGAVVLNLFRPAWDDFEVVVVLGNEESQDLLMGQTSAMEDWAGLLSDRFLRHGTYFIPAGEYDWDEDNVRSYTPALEVSDDPEAWHPDDALMVPLRSAEGALLGIVSVDEPVTGRRPSPFELELLSTVVANAAVAVEQAQTAELGRRHRAAVEHLLAVSAALTGRRSAEEVLDTICWGVREALGFHKVVIFLAEDEALAPLSGVGFTAERAARFRRLPIDAIQPLLDPEFQRHGCVVMEAAEAERRTPPELHDVYSSLSNGRGPLAWDHHWVMVPLYDEDGDLDGMMWVDDPKDRLLPSDEVLQALRVFANQAMGAIESARRLERLEHLAAHDPLTGLRNRRGFELGIDHHLDALGRDGDLSLLVIDLDHFKRINDSLGHDAGDEVLRRFAELLRTAVCDADVPTRLGGEEFALVLPGAGESRALAAAEHLRMLVRSEFEGFACPVSVSIGVASRGPEARDAGELMRAANRALYAAKRLGRDRSVVHHAQTLELLDALRDAEGAGAEQLAAAMLLAETLDLRDVATARHSETVGRYSEQIARELGFAAPRVERVRAAGILHDIGKLGIADAILHKPGRLDAHEWEEIKRHPELGSRILEHANLRDISVWVLHHHERIDGAGYPHGLTGGAIPLEARILAVADAYEAMTADRPYRRALPVAEARAELRRGAGTQFDADVVAAFERTLERAVTSYVAMRDAAAAVKAPSSAWPSAAEGASRPSSSASAATGSKPVSTASGSSR